VGSTGLLGAYYDGSIRGEIATRSLTYAGSATDKVYSLKLIGDFYNQEIAWGQSTYIVGTSGFILRNVPIETHNTGLDYSIVWIHGEVDFVKTTTSTYVLVQILRDGVVLSEVSEYSPSGQDKTIHVQWMDEPTEGPHTYSLRVYYPTGGMTYYGEQLHVVELKR